MDERATILVVEDDPNDLFFLKRAFSSVQTRCLMQAVGDGAEAIDYLRGVDDYADRQRYPIPAGVDLAKYPSVIIWCERFSVLISPADLKAAQAAK